MLIIVPVRPAPTDNLGFFSIRRAQAMDIDVSLDQPLARLAANVTDVLFGRRSSDLIAPAGPMAFHRLFDMAFLRISWGAPLLLLI